MFALSLFAILVMTVANPIPDNSWDSDTSPQDISHPQSLNLEQPSNLDQSFSSFISGQVPAVGLNQIPGENPGLLSSDFLAAVPCFGEHSKESSSLVIEASKSGDAESVPLRLTSSSFGTSPVQDIPKVNPAPGNQCPNPDEDVPPYSIPDPSPPLFTPHCGSLRAVCCTGNEVRRRKAIKAADIFDVRDCIYCKAHGHVLFSKKADVLHRHKRDTRL